MTARAQPSTIAVGRRRAHASHATLATLAALAATLLVATGCPRREPAARVTGAAPADARATHADAAVARAGATPGFRLPDGVAPIAYDVRLELDPDRTTFAGRVEVRVRLASPVSRIWLHADGLAIDRARFRITSTNAEGALTVATADHGMISLDAAQPLPAGEVALALAYAGEVDEDVQEGLFRQQVDGRWYLFTQSESVFARRIVPCFDEPRWKAAWRVSIVAPRGQVALANAPLAAAPAVADLPDGRREHRFAELAGLPPHLFAVAVGPFALVDAGRAGRAHVPVRVAVMAPAGGLATARKRTAAVAAWTPRLVDALERYLDLPLPLAKLDLVAVPTLFGAMENPGLVTFEADTLVGDPADPVYVRRLVRFLAHELAHQWFGNAVTPAWWDDLWLSEAFATWLDDKLAAELGRLDDDALRTQLARAHALETDRMPEARSLRRAVASEAEAEDAFDAIAYEKGAAVLAMFERFVGEAAFRDAVRAYIRARAGGTATAVDFVAALRAVTGPAVAEAFAAYLERPGAPIVELALRCDGKAPAAVEATPRGGATVPVCVRYAAGSGAATACALAGPSRTAIAMPQAAGCPAWLVGNADGRGYYHTAGKLAAPPVLPPSERLASGFDRAAEVARGEVRAADAVAELRALLGTQDRDPYAAIAALAIAAEIDRAVDEATAPAWGAWLAARLGPRLGASAVPSPTSPIERALRDAIIGVVPGGSAGAAAAKAASDLVERVIAGRASVRAADLEPALALAAPRGGRALFDRLAGAAKSARDPARRDLLLASLGAFGGAQAPALAELIAVGGNRAAAGAAASGLAAMLGRTETRAAAWRELRARLPRIAAAVSDAALGELLAATGSLCDPAARAEVEQAFAPYRARIPDGTRSLRRSAAAIDACVARRAALGDVAGALRH